MRTVSPRSSKRIKLDNPCDVLNGRWPWEYIHLQWTYLVKYRLIREQKLSPIGEIIQWLAIGCHNETCVQTFEIAVISWHCPTAIQEYPVARGPPLLSHGPPLNAVTLVYPGRHHGFDHKPKEMLQIPFLPIHPDAQESLITYCVLSSLATAAKHDMGHVLERGENNICPPGISSFQLP